jgi:uncharacterized protein GlcG (DUF336 family)
LPTSSGGKTPRWPKSRRRLSHRAFATTANVVTCRVVVATCEDQRARPLNGTILDDAPNPPTLGTALVTENVAILDDGGNLKAFTRRDGAPILSIEIAQNKAYTALFGIPTQDFFNFIQGDPSLLVGIPTLARVAAYGGGFPIKVDGEIVGAIGVSGGPTVQNDVDCARAALGWGLIQIYAIIMAARARPER